MSSWKKNDFVDLPSTLTSSLYSIDIKEKYIPIHIDDGVLEKVYIKEVDGKRDGPNKRLDILLLHGASFSSQNWEDLGTLALLGAMGHRAIAVDLPGYGKTKAARNASNFIDGLIKGQKLNQPIIVSPSMSGDYSLPYIFGNPATVTERIAGFVPIAPVATKNFGSEQYKICEVPVMIVVGENDSRIGPESTKNLRQFPNSELFVIKDAGHACYMNKPDEWQKLLYNFIKCIEILDFL